MARRPKTKNGLYVRFFRRKAPGEKRYLESMIVHNLSLTEIRKLIGKADEAKRLELARAAEARLTKRALAIEEMPHD